MKRWDQQGNTYAFLKITNIFALAFWFIYFLDAFLPLHNHVEIIKDFEHFRLFNRQITGERVYLKITTGSRSFTDYADDNVVFATDTLELRLTHFFEFVKQYRIISADSPSGWINNKLSRYHDWRLLFAEVGVILLVLYAVFFNPRIDTFKVICLFSIAGTFVFFLSIVT